MWLLHVMWYLWHVMWFLCLLYSNALVDSISTFLMDITRGKVRWLTVHSHNYSHDSLPSLFYSSFLLLSSSLPLLSPSFPLLASFLSPFSLCLPSSLQNKFDSSIADRIQSFTRSEPNKRKISKIKKQSKCGHSFQLTTYHQTTLCDHCDRVLWGTLYQGYQCSGKL